VRKYITKLSRAKNPEEIDKYCQRIMKHNKMQGGGARDWEHYKEGDMAKLAQVKGVADNMKLFVADQGSKIGLLSAQMKEHNDKVTALGGDLTSALKRLKEIVDSISGIDIEGDIMGDISKTFKELSELKPETPANGETIWGAMTSPSAPTTPPAAPAQP